MYPLTALLAWNINTGKVKPYENNEMYYLMLFLDSCFFLSKTTTF